MEAQEIFDKVVNHLATQKVQSKARACLYRGPNGTKCAFGIFIPDEVYSANLETHMAGILLGVARSKAAGRANIEDASSGYRAELWEAMTPELIAVLEPLQAHLNLLRELQAVHDNMDGVEDWARRLTNVANTHGLLFDRSAFELQLSGL
jgi:hypothetical protein